MMANPITKKSSSFDVNKGEKSFVTVPIGQVSGWIIYIVGLIELFLFTGCIFGWVPLVFILKGEDVFLNLCQTKKIGFHENESNLSKTDNFVEVSFLFFLKLVYTMMNY